MRPVEVEVKGEPRRYDASRRRAQAERTRAEIVEAARELLLAEGYAATTIAAISRRAHESVETTYKAFGGKPGLVRAVSERALAGTGPVPAERRSDDLQRSQSDPRTVIRGWGDLMAEVAPLVMPVLLLVRDAATQDPAMADLRAELHQSRMVRMEHNAASLAALGRMRDGMSTHDAAEVLWTYSSPELYELLVLTRGWTIERYTRFVTDAMIGALVAGTDRP